MGRIGTRNPPLKVPEDVQKDPVTITAGSGNKQVVDARGFSCLLIWPGSSGTVSWSAVHAADATAHDEEQVTSVADQVVVIPVEAAFYMIEAGTTDCDVHFLSGVITHRPVKVTAGTKRVVDCEGAVSLQLHPDPEAGTGAIKYSVVHVPTATAHGSPAAPSASSAGVVVSVTTLTGRYYLVEAITTACWAHVLYA